MTMTHSSRDHFLDENYYKKDCPPTSVPGPLAIQHGLRVARPILQTEIKTQKGSVKGPNPLKRRGWF